MGWGGMVVEWVGMMPWQRPMGADEPHGGRLGLHEKLYEPNI
jgi:hypothetical protein